MRWLLCDYGEVLSLAPDPKVRNRMVEECMMDSEAFGSRYSAHRLAYDRADVSAYARALQVLGRPVGSTQLDHLVSLDVEGWTQPNAASLAAVTRAAKRGLSLAILSNAPIELARETVRLNWLSQFCPQLYSCHLREVKPHPVIYARALQLLGADGDEVVFVDDREPNVVAARSAGMRAERFVGPEVFDEI